MNALLFALLVGCSSTEAPVEAPAAEEAAKVEAPAPEAKPEANNAAVAGTEGAERWGGDFTLTKSEPLQTLIDDPKPYLNKEVRVVGEVTNVCQAKGCWMVLRAEGGESVRITMKDHAFSVRKDLAGSQAHVQAVVMQKDVDPKTVEHYESEGANDEVPEKGKTKVIELVASAVEVAKN